LRDQKIYFEALKKFIVQIFCRILLNKILEMGNYFAREEKEEIFDKANY